MEKKIIYCKLVEKNSRKIWIIEPKQYFPDRTEVYELAVSLPQTTIDRMDHPLGCVIELDSSKLKLSNTKKYYTYTNPILEGIVDDPTNHSGYQRYLKNKDKSIEEIEAEEQKINSSLLAQLQKNSKIKPMTIESNGFYINNETFYLITRNITKSVNTMLLGPTGSGNFLRKICM